MQNKKELIMSHLTNKNYDKNKLELKLDDISVYFGQINDYNAVSFHGPEENEVIILRETCENLYNLRDSVSNVVEYLCVKLEAVNIKLKTFKSIVVGVYPKTKQKIHEAIVSDKRYNKQCIIDTELAALCTDDIVWCASQ